MKGKQKMYCVGMIALSLFILGGCHDINGQRQSNQHEREQEKRSIEEGMGEDVSEGTENVSKGEDVDVEEILDKEDIQEPKQAIDYDGMVARSLLQIGNNHRMLKAIKKAQSGEQVTLAYLGGSITQGGNASPSETNCYAYLSYEIFKDRFGTGDNVHYVNAGVAGTPSTFGMVRVDKDVLSYEPDVVVVEFAVNDEGKPLNQYIYESLVRRILKSDSQPAVILMFTVFEKGHNAQAHMQKVGEYYQLPMISVKDAIFPEIEAGNMVFKEDYGKDGLHPDNQGHKLIADFFDYYFQQVSAMNADEEIDIPSEQLFEKSYEDLYTVDVDSEIVEDLGGFTKEPINCFTYKEGLVKGQGVGKGIVMNMAFDEMIIAHQQFNKVTYGTLEIYVDDTCVTQIEGYKKDAWSNVIVTVVDNPFKDGKTHQVRFQMRDEDQEKGFVLVDVGVIER